MIPVSNLTKHILPAILLPLLASTACPEVRGERPFTAIHLGQARSLAFDLEENLLVPDPTVGVLYKLSRTGVITAVRTFGIRDPFAVAVRGDGTIFVTDTERNGVYKLDPTGGAGPVSPEQKPDTFLGPTTIAVDSAGSLYVGENDVNVVRRVGPDGSIDVFAGAYRVKGDVDGRAGEARFNRPRAIAVARDGSVYVADESSHVIRKIAPDRSVTTIAGVAGQAGSADGRGTAARFNAPRGIAVDANGTVYVMDTNNHAIRKIAPDGSVTTLAGRAGESGFADGNGAQARFSGPRGVAVDRAGNVYVGDEGNFAVRMISIDGRVSTIIAPKRPQ
jgi:sugar lactone lactonase YvrE